MCIIPRFVAQHLRILSPVPSVASVASAPSVEAPAMGAPAMEEDMGSRKSSVARPVGGAGMPCRRRMQVAARVGRFMPAKTPVIRMVAVVHLSRMEIIAGRVKTVAIYDASTMRDERLVVVDGPATMPIASPVVPTPAEAGE
jgi:hypothetical protein